MIGPGLGHNILPWLEYLNTLENYDITFLCSSFHFNERDFQNINIYQHSLKLQHIYKIRKLFNNKVFDILFIQGGNSSLNSLLLVLFVHFRISILNIWGESILDRSHSGSLRDRLSYFLLFRKIDYILFGWYGTLQKFEQLYPALKDKTWLLYLGLSKIWFSEKIDPPSLFVRNFFASIPPGKVVCIWPKSIISGNRFDLVIEALHKVSHHHSALLNNFCLFIWPGNNEEGPYRKEIENYIQLNKLTDIIKIIDHPFLEFSDMVHVMNRSDFAINFGDTDQLSNSVLEPMLLQKPLAISDIPPYRLLNEKHDLNLKLVRNDSSAIAKAFIDLLTGSHADDHDILQKRKQIICTYFQFEKDMQELFLNRLPPLIHKSSIVSI